MLGSGLDSDVNNQLKVDSDANVNSWNQVFVPPRLDVDAFESPLELYSDVENQFCGLVGSTKT